MKKMLELLITEIVDDKNDVVIEEKENNNFFSYKVKVNRDDMGHVIGKNGKMAKSIRNVMSSIANKQHKKINIEFESK